MTTSKKLKATLLIITPIIIVLAGVGTARVRCEELTGTTSLGSQCARTERCTRTIFGIEISSWNNEILVDCATGKDLK